MENKKHVSDRECIKQCNHKNMAETNDEFSLSYMLIMHVYTHLIILT